MVVGGKAQLVWNLPCMQIFVICAEASWQMTMSKDSTLMYYPCYELSSLNPGTQAKTGDQTGLIIYMYIEISYEYSAICQCN